MEVLYIHEESVHNFMAAEEVMPFIVNKFKPESVVDIGCGIGTWLKVAKNLGVRKVVGVDASYVDRNLLKLEDCEFITKDLRYPFSLNEKFDIALCLEVVEHLPENISNEIVSTLCSHSDIIIFSAAIPNQGGQNHINEQVPDFWIRIFASHGFKPYDVLRPFFWNNKKVNFWYRQNMVVFSKNNISDKFEEDFTQTFNHYVHPGLIELKMKDIEQQREQFEKYMKNPGIKNSFYMLVRALKAKFL